MKLHALRPDVGRSVRVLTSGDDAVSGTLMRVTRNSLELTTPDRPAVRIVLRRDDIRDVEVRHQTGFIQPNWVDGPSSTDLFLGGMGSHSGRAVTPASAVEGTIAVYAGVSLYADVIGSFPAKLYKRVSDTERERVGPGQGDRGSPGVRFPGSLARIVGEMPNPESTAHEMWASLVWNQILYGFGCGQVVRGSDGRPESVWPLYPNRLERRRAKDSKEAPGIASGDLYYRYEKPAGSGKYLILKAEDVLYLPLPGSMDILSPIRVARNAIGAEQAQQEYQGRFYGNSAMPSSIVTIPKGPPDKFDNRAAAYRDALTPLYSGSRNAGKLAVIEEGVTWEKAQMSMMDMQFIDTRKWSLLEVATPLRIPPYKLGYMEPGSVSYASVEQQNLAWYGDSIRPKLELIEARVNIDLGLVPGEKTLLDESLYMEFDANALLRSDNLTRAQVHATNIEHGVDTRNEARADENKPPIEGLDDSLYPVNMAVVGQDPIPASDPAALALVQAAAAFMNREQVPPRVTVNNHPPAQPVAEDGKLAEEVAGMRNELRATELLGRMKDDLESLHSLAELTVESRNEMTTIAEGILRETEATQQSLFDSVAETSKLRGQFEKSLQPTTQRVERDKKNNITAIELVDSEGTVRSRREVIRDKDSNIVEVVEASLTTKSG